MDDYGKITIAKIMIMSAIIFAETENRIIHWFENIKSLN